MARAASASESASGFIFDLQWNGANFFDVVGSEFDIGAQLFGALLTELFFGVGEETLAYVHDYCFVILKSPLRVS